MSVRMEIEMSEARDERVEGGKDLDRIAFFSDAVFAIAMTLLVLDIRVPDGLEPSQLRDGFLEQLPQIYSYALSFAVIGSFWVSHHRMFRYIRDFDGRLIWLNLLFLFFIAFLPFSSAFLGEYDESLPFTVYCVVMIATGLSLTALWLYAIHRRRLVAEDLQRTVITLGLRGGLVVPTVFLFSLVVSVFNEDAGGWAIFAGFVVWRVVVGLYDVFWSAPEEE